MKREGLKLKGFLSYDFELESIFKFLLVFMVCFLMQYDSMMSCNMSVLSVPHQKKSFCPIHKAYVLSVGFTLIPIVSSNASSLHNHG
jgi:hypothetical protein